MARYSSSHCSFSGGKKPLKPLKSAYRTIWKKSISKVTRVSYRTNKWFEYVGQGLRSPQSLAGLYDAILGSAISG